MLILSLMLAAQATALPGQSGDIAVSVNGIRNQRGVVHLCLTSDRERFLKCKADKQAMAMTLPAAKAQRLAFRDVKPGTYALLVVHDENGNGKLDMLMGIPREGFGFSSDPKIKMRAPRFDEIRFVVRPGSQSHAVRLHYVL